jgi:hypothetical protein
MSALQTNTRWLGYSLNELWEKDRICIREIESKAQDYDGGTDAAVDTQKGKDKQDSIRQTAEAVDELVGTSIACVSVLNLNRDRHPIAETSYIFICRLHEAPAGPWADPARP